LDGRGESGTDGYTPVIWLGRHIPWLGVYISEVRLLFFCCIINSCRPPTDLDKRCSCDSKAAVAVLDEYPTPEDFVGLP